VYIPTKLHQFLFSSFSGFVWKDQHTDGQMHWKQYYGWCTVIAISGYYYLWRKEYWF